MLILNNFPLVAAMIAIFISQLTKVPVTLFFSKRLDFNLVFATGGMPSSHSAGVTALITAIVLEHGWDSTLTAIAMTFGILVMFDSMGVRRQSGEHGIIINRLIAEIQILTRSITTPEENFSTDDDSLHSTEFLGHKPIEVIFGVIYGVIITLILYYLFYR